MTRSIISYNPEECDWVTMLLTGLCSNRLSTTTTLAAGAQSMSSDTSPGEKERPPVSHSLCRYNHPTFAVLCTIAQTLGRKSSKDGRVDGTNTSTSEECSC